MGSAPRCWGTPPWRPILVYVAPEAMEARAIQGSVTL
jgi:hypothetical protein